MLHERRRTPARPPAPLLLAVLLLCACSTFLRPHEGDLRGSTAAFIALWRAMLDQQRFALCR